MACFHFTSSFYLHFHLPFTSLEYILKTIIPLYFFSLTGLCILSTHKFPTFTKHNVHKFFPELNCRVFNHHYVIMIWASLHCGIKMLQNFPLFMHFVGLYLNLGLPMPPECLKHCENASKETDITNIEMSQPTKQSTQWNSNCTLHNIIRRVLKHYAVILSLYLEVWSK